MKSISGVLCPAIVALMIFGSIVHASSPVPVTGVDLAAMSELQNLRVVLGVSQTALSMVAADPSIIMLPVNSGQQRVLCVRDDEASETLAIETFNLIFSAELVNDPAPCITVLHVDEGYDIRECAGARLVYALEKEGVSDKRRTSALAK
ncbi:hypothetical protein FJ365_05370 [Candidatus Dependentiae bacterium]|nr:hypothetical protein [Candidatus Dependentiae bacterium]